MVHQRNSYWQKKPVVIIGAGCAGLTAAYELCKVGVESVVLEKDNTIGGLARTVDYKGYHFDIGGHRFFTKVKAVEDMWEEVLGSDFLKRDRLSRIYYNKRFYYYPFRAFDALRGIGPLGSILILLSYIKAQVFPQQPENTFQEWVSNRFGNRLYNIFFRTYTEKVWGMPCNQISADWAAQRIKGLSLLTAIRDAVLKNQSNGQIIKTLIDSFKYPKLGPGMMWEKVSEIVKKNGSSVVLETEIRRIYCKNNKVDYVEVTIKGKKKFIKGEHFISSMPIREMIQKIEPQPPKEVLEAASKLKYRDFITVALIVDQKDIFPNNWIYIHDPDVKVGRVQNFKNWSPHMVKDLNKTCLGLEYFCFEGDELWSMSDSELIEFGKKEMDFLGLVQSSDIEDGNVVRVPKAYPVYDSTYRDALEIIKKFLGSIKNLQQIGRNGMHKYNNQDHSMLTAMYAVKNILGGNYDLWSVNVDQEYHEEIKEVEKDSELETEPVKDLELPANAQSREFALLNSTQPLVPEYFSDKKKREHAPKTGFASKVDSIKTNGNETNGSIIHMFAKMDKLALATAVGLFGGLVTFILTIWLLIGGNGIVSYGELVSQYFIGYTVSMKGAFIGMGYGFLWGFIWGWLFAYIRNLFLGFYIFRVKRRTEYISLYDFVDHL